MLYITLNFVGRVTIFLTKLLNTHKIYYLDIRTKSKMYWDHCCLGVVDFEFTSGGVRLSEARSNALYFLPGSNDERKEFLLKL